MENLLIIKSYIIYLSITILLTLYVSKILFRSGKVFMIEIFKGDEEIAIATNNLFKVGFYLFNIGYALLIMKMSSYHVKNIQDAMETLSSKIGGFAIYLGIMLFFNLFLFFRGKKMSKKNIKTSPIEK